MVDDVHRGWGWPLLVEPGVIEGEPRAFMLPTGTVTFLLTDVEGSTQRWEAAPAAMTAAIARHYELLDQAIEGHGGVRPVEQGEGDSVVAAFSRASDAVAARWRHSERWPPSRGPRAPTSGCGWRCTRARCNCVATTTTSARR
jgi:class 3 adenylate cyclase